jgi:hypothetical protein
LDGTIVFTDSANNFAYQEALLKHNIAASDSLYNKDRITREDIAKLFIDEKLVNSICNYKNLIYCKFLSETKIHTNLLRYLQSLKNDNSIYIVTKANKERASSIINYHNLNGVFDKIFFLKNHSNKYQFVIDSLNLKPDKTIVFENDIKELYCALLAKVSLENMFLVTMESQS